MQRLVRLLTVALAALLVSGAPATSRAEEPAEAAQVGDQHLAEQDYLAASEAYGRALEGGYETAALHYNLGLVEAHLEHFGLATYHLTQAHFLAPREGDYTESLTLVRAEVDRRLAAEHTGDVVTGQPSAVSWLDMFSRLTRGESELIIIVAMWLSCGLVVIRRRLGRSGRRDGLTVSLVMSVGLLLLAAGYRVGTDFVQGRIHPGVVLTDDVNVREGPDRFAPTVAGADLIPGSVVLVREQRDDWVSVELSDGRSGWVADEGVGVVHVARD